MVDTYGVHETNGLENPRAYHETRHNNHGGMVDWTTPGLRVTRLRLLSDPGFPAWDVSYCHGVLDGQHVDVQLPFDQLIKSRKVSLSSQIVKYAIKDKIYAKGLGILDCISKLC